MKTKFLFGCILLFYCLAPSLRAQDTEFWFVAPNISEDNPGWPPSVPINAYNRPTFLAISNSTGQEAHVETTLYNGGAILTRKDTIPPGGFLKRDFTTVAEIRTIQNPLSLAGSVATFGTHITSDVKVSAYYMLDSYGTKEIFTLKGHQALGNTFYVPMQTDNMSHTNNNSFGGYDQIDIVATEDNTEVTVTPKARFSLATESPNWARADSTIVRWLNKGQTLKIREYGHDEKPTLAGTKIISTKPIAVTVTEDLVAGDTSGDQIVPVNNLGTRYVVPRGYLNDGGGASRWGISERFYLVASAPNTTVKVYYNGTQYTPISLNAAGDADRYIFPSGINAVYVEADQPVYVYQRTGYSEEGAALLPSIYAIGQKQMSFYNSASDSQWEILIFRTNTQGSFSISYGSINNTTLSVSPITIPNLPDWKVARFSLPSGTINQVVTIKNEQSPFAFGYITHRTGGNTPYGYFSAYGFELPDTTYMCTTNPSVTLEGGYAMSYEWTYNGSVISTNQNITVTQEGEYTLVMDQDPTIVTVTTFVKMINAGTICPDTVICTGTSAELSVSGASGDTFQWQSSPNNSTWTDITGATSPTYTTGALTQPAWYRRKTGANDCQMLESGSVRVGISLCMLPVNPHLMGRFRGN